MAARRRLLAEAPPGDHHKRGAPPAEWTEGYLNGWLSQPTGVFGLRLWVLIGIAVGAAIVLVLLLIFVCLSRRRRRREDLAANLYLSDPKLLKQHMQQATPTKDIPEIVRRQQQQTPPPAARPAVQLAKAEQTPPTQQQQPQRAQVPVVPTLPTRKTPGSGMSATTSGGSERGLGTPRSTGSAGAGPEVSHLGWDHWFTLRELEEATDGLAEENVIGEGGYGIVYRGTLQNSATIAVKNLLNNRGQAEKEFKVEVETIGRVRHKNLVRLLGYCVEGAYRMLVYEYVDNGNLDQWLHGDVGEVSPLTWDIRINIILATAKGYVAPEYASTGMLTERSDVYSFGVLIMEIITGRSPVDYTRAAGEVNLVEWLKTMVAERRAEEVVDPKLAEKPSPKALKRALLVALRCVDPDANKRPKMGHDKKPGREVQPQSSDRYSSKEDGSFSKRENHQYR
ncbi:hypothetical protein PR202_gb18428 [Eleusine coracana subsp. coracana]|uniref:Protein kinase domain-containing protein n=1 Tax=Eleusine coracana subsp. coracana TaxID=191504 RepID=A0AAV5F5L4_ELECO|nr:hypothetical protein PR202_gb18428 [Eleusine coracana subsp. coracana]